MRHSTSNSRAGLLQGSPTGLQRILQALGRLRVVGTELAPACRRPIRLLGPPGTGMGTYSQAKGASEIPRGSMGATLWATMTHLLAGVLLGNGIGTMDTIRIGTMAFISSVLTEHAHRGGGGGGLCAASVLICCGSREALVPPVPLFSVALLSVPLLVLCPPVRDVLLVPRSLPAVLSPTILVQGSCRHAGLIFGEQRW